MTANDSSRKLIGRAAALILRIDPSSFAVSPALVATEEEIDDMCDPIERRLTQALEEAEGAAKRPAGWTDSSARRLPHLNAPS